jgi:hypothetical protein
MGASAPILKGNIMANTKPVGVAYSDPELVAGTTITGATITGSTSTNATVSGTFTSTATTGATIANATAGLYFLTSAITANSTTTAAPVGSIGTTSNVTGTGKLFVSDGSKWQFAVVA